MSKKRRKKNPPDNTAWWVLGGALVIGVGGYFLFSKSEPTPAPVQQPVFAATLKMYFNEKTGQFTLVSEGGTVDVTLNQLQQTPDGQLFLLESQYNAMLRGDQDVRKISIVDPSGVPWKASGGKVVTAGHSPSYVTGTSQQQPQQPSMKEGLDTEPQLVTAIFDRTPLDQLNGNPWGTAW